METPEQKSDVAAKHTAISMNLVEDEETAAVIGKESIAIRRANQQILQHHVIGEEDTRRVVAHPLALGLIRAAIIFAHVNIGGDAGGLQVFRDALLLAVGDRV